MGEIDYRDLNRWQDRAKEAYKKARGELTAEIKIAPEFARAFQSRHDALTPVAEAAVVKFSDYVHSSNASFARALTEIVRLPKTSIPDSFLPYMISTIEHREKRMPASSEPLPAMSQALNKLYAEAKQHFSIPGDFHRGLAVKAGENYAQMVAERTTEAELHIANARSIAASPAQAVRWCQKLAGFTRQETEDNLSGLHVALEEVTRNTNVLWSTDPQPVRAAALDIVKRTDKFVADGMPYIQRSNGKNGDRSVPITVNPAWMIHASCQDFSIMLATVHAAPGEIRRSANPVIGMSAKV